MATIKEIIRALLDEVKTILKDYVHETENVFKKRLKKLLITSLITSILISLAISFFGSASLFILIGTIEHLSTFMPRWEAWYVTGITSGIIGAILLLALYLIIKRQFRST